MRDTSGDSGKGRGCRTVGGVRRRRVVYLALLPCVLFLTLGRPAAAQTWTGASAGIPGFDNSNWSNPFNWSPVAQPANDGTANISFGSSPRLSPNVDAAWSILSLVFNNNAGAFTLTGSTLTIGSGGITNIDSNTQTVNNNLVLSAAQTWIPAAGALNIGGSVNNNGHLLTITTTSAGNFNTTISGIYSGTGGLTKNGNGTLTLSAANTFTGTTTINTGTLTLGNALALQNSTVNIKLNNGLNLNSLSSATLGGLAGTGNLNLGATLLTVGVNNATTSYSGLFSSTGGSLTKAGTGTLTLTGVGSSIGNGVTVNGGTLSLTGGATLSSFDGLAGSAAGSNGTINISGVGTQWNATTLFVVGDEGTGTLNITNGGILNTTSLNSTSIIGFLSGSSGTVNVSGTGSRWNSAATLHVGHEGTGTLSITGGGVVNSGIGFNAGSIGSATDGTGTATVSGTGSQWNLTGDLTIGGNGTGTLSITSGGAVNVTGSTQFGSSDDSLIINGGTFTTRSLDVFAGTPTIQLTNPTNAFALGIGSGNTSSTFSHGIANSPGGAGGINKVGSGTVTLTGNNTYTGASQVSAGTLIQSGGGNSGSYTVSNGATLRFQSGAAANTNFGELRANSGGSIQYNNATVVGGFLRGPGTHTIQSGGATFNGTTTANSTTLTQGGAATLRNFSNGGTLNNNAAGLTMDFFRNDSSGTVNINNSATSQDFTNNGVMNLAATGTLNHSGSALALGGGSRTNISSGGNMYLAGVPIEVNGGLLVNNGTVAGPAGAANAGGHVNINYGGTVKGTGSFLGGYTVNEGGTFSPGNSPGILNSGSATWNPGGSFLFEINNPMGVAGTAWDLNNITGTLTVNATSASPFTLNLASLTPANAPGLLTGFDPAQNYSWEFVRTSGGIVGFDANEFNISTSGFTNDVAGGTFQVVQAGNSLMMNFTTAVPEPGTVVLLGTGLLPLGTLLLKKKRRRREIGRAGRRTNRGRDS